MRKNINGYMYSVDIKNLGRVGNTLQYLSNLRSSFSTHFGCIEMSKDTLNVVEDIYTHFDNLYASMVVLGFLMDTERS